MLNLNSVMIGTKQPQVLAAFYEKVIGKPADMVDGDQGFYGWQVGTTFLSMSAGLTCARRRPGIPALAQTPTSLPGSSGFRRYLATRPHLVFRMRQRASREH